MSFILKFWNAFDSEDECCLLWHTSPIPKTTPVEPSIACRFRLPPTHCRSASSSAASKYAHKGNSLVSYYQWDVVIRVSISRFYNPWWEENDLFERKRQITNTDYGETRIHKKHRHYVGKLGHVCALVFPAPSMIGLEDVWRGKQKKSGGLSFFS